MSTLVCSPPTPPLRRPRLRFPSPPAYHGADACSEPAPRAFADARRAGGVWGRGLRKPRMARGQTGASQVTGPSSSSAPRSSTPPRETPPRPYILPLLGFFLTIEVAPRALKQGEEKRRWSRPQ